MAANNLTNTKAELISSLVQRELINSAPLTNYMRDLSALAVKGFNSISVPKLSSFTVSDRGFGATGVDNAALTDSKDTIALDKNKIVKWNYDAADAMQSSIDYQSEAATRAGTAHGRNMNAQIASLWDTIAGLDLASVADITAGNILDMREYLQLNDADMSTVSLIVGPDQEKAMLLLPEFSRYDYRGNGAAPVMNGIIGSVYGIPVAVNNAIPLGQAFMVSSEGSAIAIQRDAKYGEESNLDYGTEGKKAVVDITYGLGGLQLGEKGANAPAIAATASPFICKLA